MTVPSPSEVVSVLEGIRTGGAAWFYLNDQGVFFLMDRASDPKGTALKQAMKMAREAHPGSTHEARGMAAIRKGVLNLVGRVAFPAAIEHLVSWTAGHLPQHPGLSALNDCCYVHLGKDKKPVSTIREPERWAALAGSGGGSGPAGAAQPTTEQSEALQAFATSSLEDLAKGASKYWIFLADSRGPCPVLVAVEQATDRKGAAFKAARKAARAAGARKARSISVVAARDGNRLVFSGRDDVPDVVGRLVRWVEHHIEEEGARALLGATYQQLDDQKNPVRTETQDDAWAALREQLDARAAAEAQAQIAEAAAHSSGEPGDTVAVIGSIEAMQWQWFWLCEAGDSAHLVLRDKASDPKRSVFESAVLQVRAELAPGRREAVGQATRLATGTWDFRTRGRFDGATALLKRWVEAHRSQHPQVEAIVGAHFLRISEEGHVQQEQLWPSPAAPRATPATGGSSASLASPATRPAATSAPRSTAKAPPPASVRPASPAPVSTPARAPASAESDALAASVPDGEAGSAAEAPPLTADVVWAPVVSKLDELEAALALLGRDSAPKELVRWAEVVAALVGDGEVAVRSLGQAGLLTGTEADPEGGAALQAGAETCLQWISKVRGPPLAARNPLTLSVPSKSTASSKNGLLEVLDGVRNLGGALGKCASKLGQYASYRSSFPPAMRNGYDSRVAEVGDALREAVGLIRHLSSETS